jgi:hypothetical protein
MGLIRNLTSSEIVSQVWNGLSIVKRENMPPMTNVVFMGKISYIIHHSILPACRPYTCYLNI